MKVSSCLTVAWCSIAGQAAGSRHGYFLASVCSYPSACLVLEDLVATRGLDDKPAWCRDLGWEDDDFHWDTQKRLHYGYTPPSLVLLFPGKLYFEAEH